MIKYVKDHMPNCVPKWALSYILSKWCGILKRTTLQDVLQYLTHSWYSWWKLLDLSKLMDYYLYTLFILLQNANSILQRLIFYPYHEFTTFLCMSFLSSMRNKRFIKRLLVKVFYNIVIRNWGIDYIFKCFYHKKRNWIGSTKLKM